MSTPIYLDAAASSPVRPEVLEAMWPVMSGQYANPASQHEWGTEASRLLEQARSRIATAMGARRSEIIFTSGGTESDNAAVKGICLAAPRGRHILISALEHPAVTESAAWLEQLGFTVEEIPVDAEGVVTAEALASRLREDTTLVSIQQASHEVGTVQRVPELAQIAHGQGAYFHTDAVQAAGSEPINMRELGVDALSMAGHKLGTPKGIGVLYLRRRTPYEPLIHGGGQQRDRRSGTQDVAGAIGMATAYEEAMATDLSGLRNRRDAFITAVESHIPGARLTGHRSRRLAGHASFTVSGHSGESLLLDLERNGVLCSAGSACAAGSADPHPAISALGVDPDLAQTAIRFSFDAQTSKAHLNYALEGLIQATSSS